MTVGAPIEQQRRDRDLARLRGPAKRGRALPVFRVDRRAAIEEGARFGLAAEPRDGEQQRRRLIFVALMERLHGERLVGAGVGGVRRACG